MKMKKHLAILFLSAACSLFAQKYLYTIELSPENLADIDPRQNTVLKTVENKKAIFVTKGNSIWLDLTLEKCLGEEITVTFRYTMTNGSVAQLRQLLKDFCTSSNPNHHFDAKINIACASLGRESHKR